MRRCMRAALICACMAAMLLLGGCGYILVEDSSSATVITAPVRSAATAEPTE